MLLTSTPDSKGPLHWKEDSSSNDLDLEDINRFINMRKDLLENDFSFKLTKNTDNLNLGNKSSENGALNIKSKTTDNVFQEVLGNTLLRTQGESIRQSFLKTEDYQLSVTKREG